MESEKELFIKSRAKALGFELCGIASVDDPRLAEASRRYSDWLSAGNAASMDYLERHEELKSDPRKLLEGCKSVISVGLLYGSTETQKSNVQISNYVRGEDYHLVLESKLDQLKNEIEKEFGAKSFSFVDKHPALDRFWGWVSGIGWIGKNSMLINRKLGSFLFLGGLLTTLELKSDSPGPDHCGRCTKCIDACPTDAIIDQKFIDSKKCISYHTIENRGVIPEEISKFMQTWVYGCDICQNVCPWNDPVTEGKAFSKKNEIFNLDLTDLIKLKKDEFKRLTKNTAMERIKYPMFLRNLAIALSNSSLGSDETTELQETIEHVIQDLPESIGKKGAESALARLQKRTQKTPEFH